MRKRPEGNTQDVKPLNRKAIGLKGSLMDLHICKYMGSLVGFLYLCLSFSLSVCLSLSCNSLSLSRARARARSLILLVKLHSLKNTETNEQTKPETSFLWKHRAVRTQVLFIGYVFLRFVYIFNQLKGCLFFIFSAHWSFFSLTETQRRWRRNVIQTVKHKGVWTEELFNFVSLPCIPSSPLSIDAFLLR